MSEDPDIPFAFPREAEVGPTDTGDQAVPLDYNRVYDKPGGPHVGPGAALNVPVSRGPASFVLDRGETSESALVGAEPELDSLRFMEAGTEWTPEAERRVHELDRLVELPRET